MGMGAHRMNVPEELKDKKLERAEMVICLPPDWKLDEKSMDDETWYWPIRLLKALARLPITCDTWLGWGHTMDNQGPYADETELCAAILVSPQGVEDGAGICVLQGGEEVNFYQVLPIHQHEMAYKMDHDADALLDKMEAVSFVVEPTRPSMLNNTNNV